MKTKLDCKTTFDDERKQPKRWVKGFLVKGKRIFHPYTLVNFEFK